MVSAANKYTLFTRRAQPLSSIIKSLSLEYHSLLLHFVLEAKLQDPFLSIMSSGWAMRSLQILLKRSRGGVTITSEGQSYYTLFLHAFIRRASVDIEPAMIIEELTLVHPASELFSTAIMEYFTPTHLHLLIERIALLW